MTYVDDAIKKINRWLKATGYSEGRLGLLAAANAGGRPTYSQRNRSDRHATSCAQVYRAKPVWAAMMPVYFARIGGRHGPIKIGHSFDPERRIKGLCLKYQRNVAIIALMDTGDKQLSLENELHMRFTALGIPGDIELFRPSRELLDFLRPHRLSRAIRKSYRSRADVIFPQGEEETVLAMKVSTASIYPHWKRNPNKSGPRFLPRKPEKP